MSNMSDVRFQNTARDFYDCAEHWSDKDDSELSEEKLDGKKAIVEFAKRNLEMEGEL